MTGLIPSVRTRLAARFRRDDGGVAAVEFAMVLPVMLALYLGTVELSQAVAVSNRVTLTSRASSDLVAQVGSSIADADFDSTIWPATQAVLAPHSSATLGLVVTSVVFEDTTNPVPKAKIAWSVARGTGVSARATRCSTLLDTNIVPAGVRLAGSSVIMAEVKMPYNPTMGYGVVGTLNLSGRTFMKPRTQNQVPYVASNGASYATCTFP